MLRNFNLILRMKRSHRSGLCKVALPDTWQIVWWRTREVREGVMVTKVWVVQWGRQWLEQKHFEDHFDQTWVAESEG